MDHVLTLSCFSTRESALSPTNHCPTSVAAVVHFCSFLSTGKSSRGKKHESVETIIIYKNNRSMK